jgi:eukaryotic-like serine/threonine-protein kinase
MQPERWAKIEEVVQLAIDCAPEERSALLDRACGTDADLRREVESLLSFSDEGGFTERSGFADGIKILEQRSVIYHRERLIGAYRIVREIGRGGMGTVYEAVRADEAFERTVAIKIIRRGLDTDDIIQRFRSERQILAKLDHPNIARLLDAGSTEDGLPYFVMECIDGEPIDQFCHSRKLDVSERLKLFQSVCAAVSYAHQNLVIHRDIKPGNVLVTRDGVPRLVDFGIAKLLAPGATTGGQTFAHPLTPEYASPEQIRGDPITTATDVFSLGILLYILLTERHPFQGSALPETEPEKPSSAVAGFKRSKLSRQLKGDLDNIVLMALRNDPRRRYASARHLAEDIGRYLENYPVLARPETRTYRAIKFIRRNKPWVASAFAVLAALVGGIAATAWQAHVAREQRDLARVEQAKAARINQFLQEMVGYSSTVPSAPNRKHDHDATVAEMLDDAAQRIETELTDQPTVKAELLQTIGGTYETQAKYDRAAHFLHEAYDLDLKLYGPSTLETAKVMQTLGNLAYLTGDYAGAYSWSEKALPVLRKRAKELPVNQWVGLLSDAAFVNRATGRSAQAEALWLEALTYAPRLPAKFRAQGIVPKTFLAQLYVDRGDIEKAEPLAYSASQELRALGEDRFSLAQSLIDLGNIRRLQRRYAEADALIEEGTNLYARSQGGDNPNVAYGLRSLADSHLGEGKNGLAEEEARHALRIVEPLGNQHNAGVVSTVLGRVLVKRGRLKEAETLLRGALKVGEREPSRQTNYMANVLAGLGECFLAQKRYSEAEASLRESYDILTAVQIPGSPAQIDAQDRLAALNAAHGKSAR